MGVRKNELNRNFIKLTQKRGISLIVLIVTIIVIIILAAAVILTVGKNNPVESAREAKFKEDIQTFQHDLALSISKDYTARAGQRDNKFSGTTLAEIQDYIPSFTKEYEGKLIVKDDQLLYEETVTEKEKKLFEDLGIKEKIVATVVAKKSQDYYGKRITNYSANGVDDWKIFYSDGNNVYLISTDYVEVEKLPAPKNGGSKPVNTNTSYIKAAPLSNVVSGYDGSSNITEEKIKALNSDYFSKGYTSINNNMKAVAYMLDTEIWSCFAGEKAEYVVGGPTVEMLMESYSQIHKVDYRSRASSDVGYEISKDGGANWVRYGVILSKSDRLYVLPISNGANAMWLASPSAMSIGNVMIVGNNGNVDRVSYIQTNIGFRPIVCLKSYVMLELDGDGYKIK